MYVGIGIAVLILLPLYTLYLSSTFLFKDDDMQSILFTILFFLSSLLLIIDIFGQRSLGIAFYGYASCFIFYILYLILRE